MTVFRPTGFTLRKMITISIPEFLHFVFAVKVLPILNVL